MAGEPSLARHWRQVWEHPLRGSWLRVSLAVIPAPFSVIATTAMMTTVMAAKHLLVFHLLTL